MSAMGTLNWHPLEGSITIGSVAGRTMAYGFVNLTHLWPVFSRGQNVVVPGAAGAVGTPHIADEFRLDVLFLVSGRYSRTGVYNTNPWLGYEQTWDYLQTNLWAPINSGDGGQTATLIKPSGASLTARVQVAYSHRNRSLNWVSEEVLTVTILDGYFS